MVPRAQSGELGHISASNPNSRRQTDPVTILICADDPLVITDEIKQ